MNKQHWTYKKLGEVCENKKQIVRASNLFLPNEIINYIDISSIDNSQNIISSTTSYSFNDAPSRAQQVVKIGDILISLVRPNLRNIAIVNSQNVNLVASSGFCILRTKDDFNNRYLFYIIRGDKFTNYLLSRVQGANYPAVKEDDIKNYPIPVPPLAEQVRIVAELDLLSGIIEKKKEQLKAYDQLAQSIFYTMFGDPIDNPKGWEVTKLKDITTKIGSGATPKGGNQSYKNEGISLIRSLNVHNGSFKYEDLAHIDEQQAHQLNNVIVEENDVLFNITGASVARCCIVPFDVLPARVNQHVSILRPKKEIVNHVYLCYYLISPNSQNALLVMSKSNAATREALPKSMMEKYSICVPPLALQQQFAEKVEAIERQKALVQQSIEETQTMFDYTMDKYFG